MNKEKGLETERKQIEEREIREACLVNIEKCLLGVYGNFLNSRSQACLFLKMQLAEKLNLVQFSCSVVSDSLRLMNRSKSGLPVHHQLAEPTQTRVH